MTRKKIIVIILTTIFIVIIAIIGYALINNYLEHMRQEKIANMSNEFVQSWANFKDETSSQYLNSISKYLSSSINTDYSDSAKEIIDMRGNNTPISSTFSITREAKVSMDGAKYNSVIVGIRDYSDYRGKSEETVHLTWGRVNNQYIITDIYTDN
jgi:hypothetical protein